MERAALVTRPRSPSLGWEDARSWAPADDSALPRLFSTFRTNLQIRCGNHTCKNTDPQSFAPAEMFAKKRVAYFQALSEYSDAVRHKDAGRIVLIRKVIHEMATQRCLKCRGSNAQSGRRVHTAKGMCHNEWLRLKHEMFNVCTSCGTHRNVQANHCATYAANAALYTQCAKSEGVATAESKYPKSTRKLFALSSNRWSNNGGVLAMQIEATKCIALCGMCHRLDESSNSARCKLSSTNNVRREYYQTHKAHRMAYNHATNSQKKRAYNNTLKQAVGRCENPDCPRDGPSAGECIDGFEQCYDWDHLNPCKKRQCISEITCNNTSFQRAVNDIDYERSFCRLLCHNCHMLRSEWDVTTLGASPAHTGVVASVR